MSISTRRFGKWALNEHGVPNQFLMKCPECGCNIIRVLSAGRTTYYDYILHDCDYDCPKMHYDFDTDYGHCECKTCKNLVRGISTKLKLPIYIDTKTGEYKKFPRSRRVEHFNTRR